MLSGSWSSFGWRQTINDLTLKDIYLGRDRCIGAVLGVLRLHHDNLVARWARLLLRWVILLLLYLMVAEVGHIFEGLEILDLVSQTAIDTDKLLLSFIYLWKSLHAAAPTILLFAIKSASTALDALRYRHVIISPTFILISFTKQDKVLAFSHINRFFKSSLIKVARLYFSLIIWKLLFALRFISHIIFIFTFFTLILFGSVFRNDGVDIFSWGLGCILDAFVLDLVLLWLSPLRN